jgi:hypothetical protein
MESGAMETKAGMVFLTLTDLQPSGEPWESRVQDEMCGRWSAVGVVSFCMHVYLPYLDHPLAPQLIFHISLDSRLVHSVAAHCFSDS